MKLILGIDIETYSPVSLPKAGVYRYVDTDEFEILLFSYAYDDDPVQTVDLACREMIPDSVLADLENLDVIKAAYNGVALQGGDVALPEHQPLILRASWEFFCIHNALFPRHLLEKRIVSCNSAVVKVLNVNLCRIWAGSGVLWSSYYGCSGP